MRDRLWLVAVVIVCATAAFAWRQVDLRSNDQRLADADDVREAAFRWYIRPEAGKDREGFAFPLYFLSVDRKPASSSFLTRFSNLQRGAVTSSADADRSSRRGGVRDRRSDQSGCLLGVDDLAWQGANRAQIDFWYHFDGLGAASMTLTLVREASGWTVIDRKLNWIS